MNWQHGSHVGLGEESSDVMWLLPSMEATEDGAAGVSEWTREKTAPFEALNDAKVGEARVEDAPLAEACVDGALRWLEQIGAQDKLTRAVVYGPQGAPVTFAVSDGGIVSAPRCEQSRYEDEQFINECGGVGVLGEVEAIERMFVRLLDGCERLEFEPWDASFVADMLRIEPHDVLRWAADGDPSDTVWRMLSSLGSRPETWWIWRRGEAGFELADCSGRDAFTAAQDVIAGVGPLVRSVRDDAPSHSMLLNGSGGSSHLCWSSDWVLVHDAMSIGHVLCGYDASAS